MPRQRHRYFREEDDGNFETEAFAHLNEEPADESQLPENEQEPEDSDPEDMQHIEDSDDEAPDDVGFHESRESVLTQLRSALRQVDADKQKKKNKRKLLDAQFREQKAKKQQELVNSKLPDDFLESIDDVIPKKIKKPDVKKSQVKEKKKGSESQKTIGNGDSEEEDRTEDTHISKHNEDYIAFTDRASGVQVADMRHIKSQSHSIAQVALDFRQNRLYGKCVKRESNQQRLAKAEKRRHRVR